MKVGTANIMKFEDIDKPELISKPPKNGPTIAPSLPMPTAAPTPDALISVAYTFAAKLYMPTNPP
jgi:hypothetical protein